MLMVSSPRKNVGWQGGGEAAMSARSEENKTLVRRFLEELDKGNLDIIDELLSPDFVDRSLVPGQGPTREDFKRSRNSTTPSIPPASPSRSRSPRVTRSSPSSGRAASVGASTPAYLLRGWRKLSYSSTSTAYPKARSPRSGARLMFVRSG